MVSKTKRLVESAVMVALGTALSLFPFSNFWPLGGGITVCSMLPIVIIAYRYDTGWSVFTATVYAVLQMMLGFANVQYATNALQAIGIVMFDYILAFGVIGFSGCFKNVLKGPPLALSLGIALTFTARFICHFISGVIIWEALWPNELGWAAPLWSLAYNGSYMLPEIIISVAAALLIYKPLGKYLRGEDLRS